MGKEKKDELKAEMANLVKDLGEMKAEAQAAEAKAKEIRLAMHSKRERRDEIQKELLKGKIKELTAKVEA